MEKNNSGIKQFFKKKIDDINSLVDLKEKKEKQIKELMTDIIQIKKDMLFGELDKLKNMGGCEFEDLLYQYIDKSCQTITTSQSEDSLGYITDSTDEEIDIPDYKPNKSFVLSEDEKTFIKKFGPEVGRKYKYGIKGVSIVNKPNRKYHFKGMCWVLKTNVYRTFDELWKAKEYGIKFWDTYPKLDDN